ncbi:hypothetical protein [Rugamonas violacea]
MQYPGFLCFEKYLPGQNILALTATISATIGKAAAFAAMLSP